MRPVADHIAWSQQRALDWLDKGLLSIAVASMISDLNDHEETKWAAPLLIVPGTLSIKGGEDGVRRWIEGFG